MIGISIRYAVAVGMHVRNDDQSIPQEKKDTLVRTWWSLQLIECLLSSMIGRPCVIPDDHCTVPMIKHITDETDNTATVTHEVQFEGFSGIGSDGLSTGASSAADMSHRGLHKHSLTSYLEARIQVSLITQKALSLLYAPPVASYSWASIQKSILSLTTQLDNWMPATFDSRPDELYPSIGQQSYSTVYRERVMLYFQLFSTRILVTRPCLCRLTERTKHHSDRSTQLNHEIAMSCIQAAQDLTSLLPDEPQAKWVYRNGPWWSIVHNIMQAATVFLVQLSKRQTDLKNPSDETSASLKKLFRWLRAMAYQDAVARRAYQVVFDTLKTSAQQFRFDIKDLLAEEANIGRISEAGSDRLYNSFMTDPKSSTPSQQPRHFIDPTLVEPSSNIEIFPQLQISQDQLDLQLDSFLDQYQTPPLYGNPYATPFDSDIDSRWSPSFDSFVELQGNDEQNRMNE